MKPLHAPEVLSLSTLEPWALEPEATTRESMCYKERSHKIQQRFHVQDWTQPICLSCLAERFIMNKKQGKCWLHPLYPHWSPGGSRDRKTIHWGQQSVILCATVLTGSLMEKRRTGRFLLAWVPRILQPWLHFPLLVEASLDLGENQGSGQRKTQGL